MKKILFLIESLGSGGAERQLVGLAVMLSKQNYNVHVCYYVDNDFYSSILKENGIDYTCLRTYGSRGIRFVKMYIIIRRMMPNVVMSYLDTPNMVACLCKMLGLKYRLIVSERNTTQELTQREKIKFLLYKYSDYIVSNSFTQNLFINKNYPNLSKKTLAILNYINVELFYPNLDIERTELRKCLCVGRVTAQKNVLNFIYAIKEMSDRKYQISVDWYGDQSDSAYFDKCICLINELNLNHIFSFLSPVQNLADKYREMDFFCLPSIYEGFPNTLCEAMSSGLPLLCSDVCDNPNIVKHGVNGFLFSPLSISDIVDKLIMMSELSPEAIRVMRETNRHDSLCKFSKRIFLESYLEILN